MTRAAAGASAKASMRIALVGDLHDFALGIWPWEMLGKTIAGQMNLWLNRRKKFERGLIAPTIARVVQCKPDLVLFSGDLTTTSRPREFRSVAAALAPLLNATDAVIVPGNHDRYTFTARRVRRIERAFAGRVPEVFPSARPLIGRWRLIAVDSAVPRLFDSRGCIGNRQLQHVRSLLSSVGEEDGVVVLCHYPFGKPTPLPPMKSGHRLLDELDWRDTIASCRGRVIIVHGHVHCPWLWHVEGHRTQTTSSGAPLPLRVLDINAGSPTMVGGGHAGAWPRGQGFWTMDLPADPSLDIALTHHVMGDGEAPVGVDPATSPAQSDAASPVWSKRDVSVTI